MTSQRWLYGPIPDLLLGCGLVYCIAFVGLSLAGPQMRELLPLELTPLVLLITGIPHYGATLLRVYEQRSDRHRYAVFAALATILVWGIFAIGVYEFTVGSLMLTIYLTWSPWHYAGQNYGIAMMFLRRRGVEVSRWTRNLFQWSFFLSFVLTFLALHGAAPGVLYAPGEYQRSVYTIISLGIPRGAILVLMPLCTGAYLACLGMSIYQLRRVGSWRDLAPALLLAASQSLWFTIPLLARYTGIMGGVEPFGLEHTAYAFLWIAVAHATQYLWITSYFARNSPHPPSSQVAYFARALLAGAAIWVVPSLIFAPGLLGLAPFDAGLGALVAAAVNLHHFLLDGAIWKLREGRIANVLLRGQRSDDATDDRHSNVWIPRVIWGVGALAVVILVWSPLERTYGLANATLSNDLERIETAQTRLAWMGRESGLVHVMTALMYQRAGDAAAAERHAGAARRLGYDYATLGNLSVYYATAGRIDDAVEALQEALTMQPDSANLNDKMATLLITFRAGDAAAGWRAIEHAERAVQMDDQPEYRTTLALAYAGVDRLDDAIRTAEEGREQARERGDSRLETLLNARIADWRQSLRRRN